MDYFDQVNTPIGTIGLQATQEYLLKVDLHPGPVPPTMAASIPLLAEAKKQLIAYFQGRLHTFSIPLHIPQSSFLSSVLQVLQKIPYGSTWTYLQVADYLRKPKSARAVGQACHNNPLAIFIPCHRVVGSRGQLGGYNGGITIKKYLLGLEQCS